MKKEKRKTVDYTFKDIIADKQIKNYLNCGEVKIKRCMNSIEEKYFDGKRIYHAISSKEKSDFLFRFEIKGLLLLLLKLEIEDPIDGRTQKKGVSSLNVKKMITSITPQYLDVLNNYEFKLVVQYCDPEHLNSIYDILEQTQKSLMHLAVVYAKNYDNFIWGLSRSIQHKIDQITKMIIGRTYGNDDLKIGTILEMNNALTRLVPSSYNVQIGLKEAVIKAIKRITRDIYYFDENNVCYRKIYLPKSESTFENIRNKFCILQLKHIDVPWKDKRIENKILSKHSKIDDIYYMEDKNDKTFDRCAEYTVSDDLNSEDLKTVRRLYKNQKEIELAEDEISEIQNCIEMILFNYYDESCGKQLEVYEDYRYYDKIEKSINKLENDFTNYVEYLYELQIHGLKNNKKYSLKDLIDYRKKIEKVIICDIEFDMHLSFFEAKFFEKFSYSNCEDGQFLYTLIEETLNNFKEEIIYVRSDVEKEFELIDSSDYKNTPYESIEENIERLKNLIDELVNEVYAMIIRLRKEKE